MQNINKYRLCFQDQETFLERNNSKRIYCYNISSYCNQVKTDNLWTYKNDTVETKCSSLCTHDFTRIVQLVSSRLMQKHLRPRGNEKKNPRSSKGSLTMWNSAWLIPIKEKVKRHLDIHRYILKEKYFQYFRIFKQCWEKRSDFKMWLSLEIRQNSH